MFVVTEENRRWWTVVTMALPVIILTIDFFGVSVALPSIGRELGGSTSSLAWVINAFMLGLAGVLVVGGRLGDLVGRRKMLLAGVVLFLGGSIVCGIAQSEAVLIAGRALQGVAAAFTYSNSLSIVSNAFSADQRGIGIGLWIGIGAVGSAIGPFVGGLLTEELSWRWLFYVNVPFGAAAVAMTLLVVQESRDEGAPPSIDWIGCLLAITGCVLLVMGLEFTARLGWDSSLVWAVLGGAVVVLIGFVIAETRVKNPLIQFGLFASRDFIGSALVGVLINFTLGALMLFLTLYLQHVGDLSPLKTGFVFLAFSLVLAGMSTATGYIGAAWGARQAIALGMALNCASFAILVFGGTAVAVVLVVLALVLGGAGQALAYNTSTAVAMGTVPSDKAGAASGVIGSIRILAVAVGVAVTTAVFKAVETNRLAALIGEAGGTATAADIREATAVVSGSDALAAALAKMSPAAAQHITVIVDQAFVSGFGVVMTICAGLSAAGIVAAFLIRRSYSGPTETV
jgi:EmrB/QacA subfamily drug resistance transporter